MHFHRLERGADQKCVFHDLQYWLFVRLFSLKGEEYSDGSLQQSVEIRTISAILASDSIALENGETHGFEARHMDGVSRRHKQ